MIVPNLTENGQGYQSNTWSHTIASGCQCLQAKHKVYVSKHHVSTFNVNFFWLWFVSHDNKYRKELCDCAVLPTFCKIDDGNELWFTTLELKGRCLILVWHINSVDYGLINSASIDGGSWCISSFLVFSSLVSIILSCLFAWEREISIF